MSRKKDYLIPKEKAKHSIYLTPRRPGNKYAGFSVLFLILGIIFILYCFGIMLFVNYGSLFYLLWGVMGICCFLLSFILAKEKIRKAIPKFIKVIFWSLFAIGLVLFFVIEGLIISKWDDKPANGADYCVVLGAWLKEGGPSYVLKMRLDAAVDYLQNNPDTKVIVSGGQGSNEPMSEAEGMQIYLIGHGIDAERILLESNSVNTVQNLKYSAELLNPSKDQVVIVTNNFHVFRATAIAKKMGYQNVSGLSAKAYPALLPNNMLREFIGVLKDFFFRNL